MSKKVLYLMIDEKIKEELKKEAEAKGLNLSNYIRVILADRKK